VAIYDADAKTLIDSVTIPATLPADASLARSVDGKGQWIVRDGSNGAVTPGSANVIKGSNPKIRDFGENDSHGFAITLMAMSIVFSALLVLCLAFYGIGLIGKRVSRFNKARAQGKVGREEVLHTEHDSGEEIAAIVMALHEHLNAHDTENTILTINKVKRAYSPWSSKIYGLREVPRR
jgi:sodium pump decarboxylase gamma subunit